MKRLFFTVLATVAIGTATNAQTAETAGATATEKTAKPELTKEQKAKLKQLKADNIAASYKEAGLTEEQTKKATEVNEASTKLSHELKANNKLTDPEKEAKKKEINDDKNAKLKEIMGDKYKTWTAIRKKQKEAEMAFENGPR